MKLHTIAERTDREWPADHPLRKVSRVISDEGVGRAEFLVCTLVGEERLPPAVNDHDMLDACTKCGTGIVHRASASARPKPICWKCWTKIE